MNEVMYNANTCIDYKHSNIRNTFDLYVYSFNNNVYIMLQCSSLLMMNILLL